MDESTMKNGGGDKSAEKMYRLVLGLHTLSGIRTRGYFIVIYIFALLTYIGIFFGLLASNFQEQEFIEKHYYKPFHLLSFWGIFAFTIIEAFVLMVSNLVAKSRLQNLLLSFNIVTTLLTAIFFTFYPEFYEVPAHYVEYTIQIFISGVNLIFVLNVIRRKDGANSVFYKYRYVELFVAMSIIVLSIFQLLFYSNAIPTHEPERTGHFCEFVNEILNGLFALWYASVIYLDNEKEHHRCEASLRGAP